MKRGHLLYILIGILLIPTAYSYNYYCYQESANTTNQTGIDTCSLTYTGSYGILTSIGGYDYGEIQVNYTKPNNAVSAIWQVKYGPSSPTPTNITIPDSCYYYDANKILLKFVSGQYSGNKGSHGYCYNGAWINIAERKTTTTTYTCTPALCPAGTGIEFFDGNWNTQTVGGRWKTYWSGGIEPSLYEEAIIWNISIPNQSITSISISPTLPTNTSNITGACSILSEEPSYRQYNWYLNDTLQQSGTDTFTQCLQDTANNNNTGCAYSSGTYSVYNDSTWGYLEIDYAKPTNAFGMIWQTKTSDLATRNITIPSSCFNFYRNEVKLRIASAIGTTELGSGGASKLECYSGTWNNITTKEYAASFVAPLSSDYTLMYDNNYATGVCYSLSSGEWGSYCDAFGNAKAAVYEESAYWNYSVTTNINYTGNQTRGANLTFECYYCNSTNCPTAQNISTWIYPRYGIGGAMGPAPWVNLTYPTNGSYLLPQAFDATWQAQNEIYEAISCDLIIDNQYFGSDTTDAGDPADYNLTTHVNYCPGGIICISPILYSGTHTWYTECTNGLYSNTSQNWTFTILAAATSTPYISPSTIYSNTSVYGYCNVSDGNTNIVYANYTFYINGTPAQTGYAMFNTLSEPGIYLSSPHTRGKNISFSCIINNTYFTYNGNSTNITVSNTQPSVTIALSIGTTDEAITCLVNSTDIDGDNLNTTYYWYRNNNLTNESLSTYSGTYNAGDVIRCNVTVTDGYSPVRTSISGTVGSGTYIQCKAGDTLCPIFKGVGAGFGKFLEYMGNSLAPLLFGLAIIIAVGAVGLGLAVAIKHGIHKE